MLLEWLFKFCKKEEITVT